MALPNYPPCANGCVAIAYAEIGCRYGDGKCSCTNGGSNFSNKLQQCVVWSCFKSDADKTVRMAEQYCDAVNKQTQPAPQPAPIPDAPKPTQTPAPAQPAPTPAAAEPTQAPVPAPAPAATTPAAVVAPAATSAASNTPDTPNNPPNNPSPVASPSPNTETKASPTPISLSPHPTSKPSLHVNTADSQIVITSDSAGLSILTTTLHESGTNTAGPTIITTSVILNSTPTDRRNGLSAGAAAGIAIVVILGLLILLVCGWFILRKYRQKRDQERGRRRMNSMVGMPPISQQQMLEASGLSENAKAIGRGLDVNPNQDIRQYQNPVGQKPVTPIQDQSSFNDPITPPPGFHEVNNGAGYYEMETVERKVELFSPTTITNNAPAIINFNDETKGRGNGRGQVQVFPKFVEVTTHDARDRMRGKPLPLPPTPGTGAVEMDAQSQTTTARAVSYVPSTLLLPRPLQAPSEEALSPLSPGGSSARGLLSPGAMSPLSPLSPDASSTTEGTGVTCYFALDNNTIGRDGANTLERQKSRYGRGISERVLRAKRERDRARDRESDVFSLTTVGTSILRTDTLGSNTMSEGTMRSNTMRSERIVPTEELGMRSFWVSSP